jgi:selenocysteine lyase/cysteine desulfurase
VSTPWDEVRKDFPALQRRVYLNAAATGLPPPTVREAVDRFYRELEEGGDVHWDDWMERREQVRARVAALIGAEAEEIAFVPNTSTGMNLIADLVAADGPVISDELEFPAVTLPWIHRGVTVHFMPAVEGILRLESFMKPYAPRAATIAISHIQFSNGCRQDLEAFGLIKDDRHLVVSASQSAGAFPIDVRRSQVDGLASAGHKWLGAGYSAGFVFIRGGLLLQRPPRAIGWMSVERPFAFDNRQFTILPGNRRTEVGCPAFPAIFALGAAVDYALDLGIEKIEARVLQLNAYLTEALERAGIPVLSPGGAYRSAETLCAVDDPPRAAAFLRERGIEVTMKPEGLRISTHYYNSEPDVDTCVAALADYARDMGEIP